MISLLLNKSQQKHKNGYKLRKNICLESQENGPLEDKFKEISVYKIDKEASKHANSHSEMFTASDNKRLSYYRHLTQQTLPLNRQSPLLCPNSKHWFTTSFLHPLSWLTDQAICLEKMSANGQVLR